MALLTITLLQVLSRAFQATESFVYQQKSPIQLYIFKTCQTLSIVIGVGILHISRVFQRIFTHLLYGSWPLMIFFNVQVKKIKDTNIRRSSMLLQLTLLLLPVPL